MNENNSSGFPLQKNCSVLFEFPSGIVAFEKAAGTLSHPNIGKSEKQSSPRSFLNAPFDHDGEFYYLEDGSKIFLVHRLDSPTSGVLLATTNLDASKALKNAFKHREVRKTYYAIVRCRSNPRLGTWKDSLIERKNAGKLRVVRGKGSLAITDASLTRKPGGLYGLSMLKLIPKTGRTHQLRVQSAIRDLPIIGDRSYGDFSLNRKIARASKVDRLCLHAANIECEVIMEGKPIKIHAESPLPRSFGKLLS
ncbi:MAG: hypothetical protein CMI27_01210 [Opitutae bacterium]|nr:hypothetical protein [Opitutae bacterium]|tara:strand:+ start:1509 stop:2261 length:753 start_codon:yes stop_codon:yes gene_type:complete